MPYTKKHPAFTLGAFVIWQTFWQTNMLFLMSWSSFNTAKMPLYRGSNSKLHYNSIRIRSSKVAYS